MEEERGRREKDRPWAGMREIEGRPAGERPGVRQRRALSRGGVDHWAVSAHFFSKDLPSIIGDVPKRPLCNNRFTRVKPQRAFRPDRLFRELLTPLPAGSQFFSGKNIC